MVERLQTKENKNTRDNQRRLNSESNENNLTYCSKSDSELNESNLAYCSKFNLDTNESSLAYCSKSDLESNESNLAYQRQSDSKTNMRCLEYYRQLNSKSDKEYIEMFLIYALATLISGVKPGTTVTIKKNKRVLYESWSQYGGEFLESIGLKYIYLRETESCLVVMIYDEESIMKCVSTMEHKEFLSKLGYKGLEVDDYISRLKDRYERYHCPHELGLFLGIPIEDVKAFMDCSEQKCLMCGYWKVYYNRETAEELFRKYDMVRDFAIENLIIGNNSVSIVNCIRENFIN
ncbi:MAG: DUF3793 family protein [Clostridioides sp.]|nr:DUF3793 family protein [Clostridioides sp.]